MKVDALHGQRVYLDTNGLVYAFEGDPAGQSAGVGILWQAIRARQVLACASVLVRAEVMVMPVRDVDDSRIAFYRHLFDASALVHEAPLGPAVADAAAVLRARYPSLKLVDALHLAAATKSSCRYFLSADRRLHAAARGPLTMFTYDDLG